VPEGLYPLLALVTLAALAAVLYLRTVLEALRAGEGAKRWLALVPPLAPILAYRAGKRASVWALALCLGLYAAVALILPA